MLPRVQVETSNYRASKLWQYLHRSQKATVKKICTFKMQNETYAELDSTEHKIFALFMRRQTHNSVYPLICVEHGVSGLFLQVRNVVCLSEICNNLGLNQSCNYCSLIFPHQQIVWTYCLPFSWFYLPNYIPNGPMGLLNIWVLTMKNVHSFNTNFVNCLNNSLYNVIVFSTSTFNF